MICVDASIASKVYQIRVAQSLKSFEIKEVLFLNGVYLLMLQNNGLLLGQPRQVRRQVHVRH